jgi:hypothetical protein
MAQQKQEQIVKIGYLKAASASSACSRPGRRSRAWTGSAPASSGLFGSAPTPGVGFGATPKPGHLDRHSPPQLPVAVSLVRHRRRLQLLVAVCRDAGAPPLLVVYS